MDNVAATDSGRSAEATWLHPVFRVGVDGNNRRTVLDDDIRSYEKWTYTLVPSVKGKSAPLG